MFVCAFSFNSFFVADDDAELMTEDFPNETFNCAPPLSSEENVLYSRL